MPGKLMVSDGWVGCLRGLHVEPIDSKIHIFHSEALNIRSD